MVTGSQQDTRKLVREESAAVDNVRRGRERGQSRKREAPGGGSLRQTPRWRQIEIMRERQALRDMLDDFGGDDIELDDEVFGVDGQDMTWFKAISEDEEAGESLEDDEFVDDEFDED